MRVEKFFLGSNTIAAFDENKHVQVLNREHFEQWMETNDRLQWHVPDEMFGEPIIIPITAADFWQAHASYIQMMLADYIQSLASKDKKIDLELADFL